MFKHIMSTGTSNTNIAKTFNVHRNIATRWMKENELANVLKEPSDDKVL